MAATSLATLFAERVILEKSTFDTVPPQLKAEVANILMGSSLGYLVAKEYGGTRE